MVLLISDLTLLDKEDTETLKAIYAEGSLKSNGYEIISVPIGNVGDHAQFEGTIYQMARYSCHSNVGKAAEKFINKVWQFKQQMQVVVLSEQGALVNTNAMMMIRLWRSEALPFSLERACKLWDKYRNKWLTLVVDNTVFPSVEQSSVGQPQSKELILLYGSAEDSEICTKIEGHLSNIKTKVSFTFKSVNINAKRARFCSLLRNCISSWMQVSTKMSDPLTREQLKVYTSYKSKSGFAILTEGSSVKFNISVTSLEKVLSQYEKWMKNGVNMEDFYKQFGVYYMKTIGEPPCLEFEIPGMVGNNIPEYNLCSKEGCKLNMEKVVTFKCCHNAH